MNDIEVPSWLVEGAEVLAYSPYSSGTHRPAITKIKKISTKSFTLDAEGEPRYSLADQSHVSREAWSSNVRNVVPLDSDQARVEIRREKELRRVKKADSAVDEWRRKHTWESRLAAIAALQAIENDEV
jgi:hypothetical protein